MGMMQDSSQGPSADIVFQWCLFRNIDDKFAINEFTTNQLTSSELGGLGHWGRLRPTGNSALVIHFLHLNANIHTYFIWMALMQIKCILSTLQNEWETKLHLYSLSSHLNLFFCSFPQKQTPTHNIHSTRTSLFEVKGHLSSAVVPPRTVVAVYSCRPWRLLYPLHFNTAQETESGDANEISPPQLPSSTLSGYCLHPGHINQMEEEED